MKIYEQMGFDPTTLDGFQRMKHISCKAIPDSVRAENMKCGICLKQEACTDCITERLFAEVKE